METQTQERQPSAEQTKVAVVVLADIETHEDLARVTNAMMTAREFKEAGDEVQLIFDGAGTRWPGELSRREHKSHALYETISDRVAGVCGFCARAFHADHAAAEAGVDFLEEYHKHPSIRRLVIDGYQILTF